jgi:hypothetical protein
MVRSAAVAGAQPEEKGSKDGDDDDIRGHSRTSTQTESAAASAAGTLAGWPCPGTVSLKVNATRTENRTQLDT